MALGITSWNKAAAELYGWKADEVIGKILDDLLKTEFVEVSQEDAQEELLRRWRA